MLRKLKDTINKKERLDSFYKEKDKFKSLEKATVSRFELNDEDIKPCLYDNTKKTGFDRHYIYHTGWAAKILRGNMPEKHIDISSILYFTSIISAFIPIEFYDYRPANLVLDNLESLQADLTSLHFLDDSIQSLSCMHTVEHVGLGRYGDPLDYDGDIKAINELSRVLAKNGNLLFVVPVGRKPRIQFNAHRIYTKDLVLSLFSSLTLKEFTLIPEKPVDGGLVTNPDEELLKRQNYACGCFWFTKL